MKKTTKRNTRSAKYSKRTVRRFGWRSLALVVAGILFVGTASWVITVRAATVTNRALIYGDSITYEAANHVYGKFASKRSWSLRIHAYPGIALCDMTAQLQNDLNTLNPTVVVLETQGNTYTDCMRDANGNLYAYGSQGWLDKYRADLNAFVAAVSARGVKTVLVSPLPTSNATVNTAVTSLTNVEREVAGSYSKVSIANGPRTAVTKSGKYTPTKPCLATETAEMGCTAGQIKVRSPDGVHLCPVNINDNFLAGCPIYSSGIHRYGNALVSATVNPPAPLVP